MKLLQVPADPFLPQSCTATPRSPSSAPTGDASRRIFTLKVPALGSAPRGSGQPPWVRVGPPGRHPAGCRVPFPVQGRRWLELDGAQQKAYIMRLLDGLEVVNRDKRLKVARAILYLAQGKDHIPRVWMWPLIRCLASARGLGRSLLLGLCQVTAVKLLPGMVPCTPGVQRQLPPNQCLPLGLSRRLRRLR